MKQKELYQKLFIVIFFAVAFGFVEAAVVVYLRNILGIGAGVGYGQVEINKNQILLLLPGLAFLEPGTAAQIITKPAILSIEQFRELATLIMLVGVAFLAGRNLKARFAYFLLAFGIWDIFYYIFLKLTIGWPSSLVDLDIFFLLPVPWVGPVITPLVVSILMIASAFILLLKKLKISPKTE